MGDVIDLAERRFQRVPGGTEGHGRFARVVFSFDLASPFTYLAAERVDGLFDALTWRPVLEEAIGPVTHDRDHAEERAAALGLPLVWPDNPWSSAARLRPVMRVAALATEQGRAAPFVLAASRLAYCGGFPLDHPETIAEAAAAAGLGLEDALRAAGDARRDEPMEEAARRLRDQGADCLPALRVGRLLFAGEHRVCEALAASHAPSREVV